MRWKEIDQELRKCDRNKRGDKREQMEKGREEKKVMGGAGRQKREEEKLDQPMLLEG